MISSPRGKRETRWRQLGITTEMPFYEMVPSPLTRVWEKENIGDQSKTWRELKPPTGPNKFGTILRTYVNQLLIAAFRSAP